MKMFDSAYKPCEHILPVQTVRVERDRPRNLQNCPPVGLFLNTQSVAPQKEKIFKRTKKSSRTPRF